MRLAVDLAQHGLDAPLILSEAGAADLHLDDVIAALNIGAHLGAECAVILAGVIISAGGIDEDLRICSAAFALGKQAEEGLAGDFCHRIPYRHVDRAHRHRALAMAAGLFIGHHRCPDPVRAEIVIGLIDQTCGVCRQNAIAEALADEPALTIAAIGVEAVANDALAAAHHIGDDGNQARRHF